MSALPITLTRAVPGDRLRDLGLFAALVLWLAYTRIFWVLQAAHIAAPPCPFFYLTGHPCPFCGGTRSFAYMWRGDLADAVRLYPLGPAMLAGAVATTAALAAGAITGRTWTPRLTAAQWRVLGIGAASAVAASWALKVFVLGN
ncbi:MAG TPA: DUF2752 domain-containing protein [Candidatus Sulfotelmatobacter sp.]|nr:DUF2752 domain-containing protein [Candidatus Sulfotelmatobacter sp.]